MPSEYYWRARNANTSHQNTISGREDHQRGTQCHQNTIRGREDHQRGTQCHQNTISGRRDDDSRTQCHQNTISGRENNQRGTQCHQNTISGRKDRGPPRLGLTKLLTSGRRGFIYFFSVRRLLGSRQVVTQCLCQLNELCSVMHHHSLFGVSKKSMNLYAVQVVQVRCNHRKQETSENQKGATNQTQQNKNSTKNNKQENHIIAVDKTALCEFQQLMCWWLSLACIEKNTQNREIQLQGAREGCKNTQHVAETRGPPARNPEITTRRPQGTTGTTIPNRYHTLHEGSNGPAAGTLPWYAMQAKIKPKSVKQIYREPKEVKRVKQSTPLRVRLCVLLLSSATIGHCLGRDLYVAHSLIALCLTYMTCQGIFGCMAGWHTDVVGPVLQWCQAESRSSCHWPSTPVEEGLSMPDSVVHP